MNCTDRRLEDLARAETERRRQRRIAAVERVTLAGSWWAIAVGALIGGLRWAGVGR
jgi:hypothetical protein